MLLQSNRLMENKLYLFGASGHCKVVVDILHSNKESVTAILDDQPKIEQLLHIPVMPSSNFSFDKASKFIVSIGDNASRKRIVERIHSDYYSAIHSQAIISDFATIGQGSVVMAAAVINAGATVGQHCIINTAAILEHDCVVEDYVHLSPNAAIAGGVQVGEGSHIGIGATVIQGITIGKWVTIGAGAVIISNVPDYATVVGNPGRIIKNKKNE